MKNMLLALLLITYPVIVYFGLQYVEPGIVAVVFALIFIFRYRIQRKNQSKSKIPHLNVLLAAVLSLLAYSTFANSAMALKFYPVVVSLSFLGIFAYSLFKPPSVVEMIARLHEELDEQGIRYTRKVTKVWCGFFILNALIATFTIFQENDQVWLVYNGFLSYIFMGILMAGEFVVRFFVKRKNQQVTKLAANKLKE
jgi:uncharacterized membrane protein